MSASEKLKELARKRDPNWQASMTVSGTLIYALPQLVALVEAAENCFRVEQPDWNTVEHRMAVALAELEKALS